MELVAFPQSTHTHRITHSGLEHIACVRLVFESFVEFCSALVTVAMACMVNTHTEQRFLATIFIY